MSTGQEADSGASAGVDSGRSDVEKTRGMVDEALTGEPASDLRSFVQMLAKTAGTAIEMGMLPDALRILERGHVMAREARDTRLSLRFAEMECNTWFFQDRLDLALAKQEKLLADLSTGRQLQGRWLAYRIHWEARSGLLGQVQKHLGEYTGALASGAPHPRVLLAEADFWLEAGELGRALACSDRAIADATDYIPFTWGWEPRIRLLLGLGRIEEAEALAEEHGAKASPGRRVAARHPAVLPALRAAIALARDERDALRRHVAEVLDAPQLRPIEKNRALFLLAQEALVSGRPRGARVILQRLDPGQRDWRCAAAWARLCVGEGKNEEARRHVARLLDPRFPLLAAERFRWAREMSVYQTVQLLSPARPAVAPAAPVPEMRSAPPRQAAAGLHAAELRLVGVSPALERVRGQIARFASESAPVLITGETGTGKEVVATLLHRRGPRASAPLLPVNCAALSGALIESELFGHVRGAFSGATRDHAGIFLAAKNGTVLLDEIQVLPLESQARLLRVLENGEVRPVGSSRARKCEARIIATSNRRLEDAVAQQRFRSDLFYRLARLRIDIPPLRERKEDILPLARFFLSQFYEEFDVSFTSDLADRLQAYDYPGNVRELRNRIERIAVFAGDGPVLDAEWLDTAPDSPPSPATSPPPGSAADPCMPSVPDLPGHARLNTEDRRDRIMELFARHKRLTRKKVILLLGCSGGTASRDLATLEQRGLIRRVITSGNLCTSYYERC